MRCFETVVRLRAVSVAPHFRSTVTTIGMAQLLPKGHLKA